MTHVSDNYYDTYDPQTSAVGDGNLTRSVLYPNGVTNAAQVTEDYYDWRDRLVATKSGVLLDGNNRFENHAGETDGVHRPITYYTYDNLDQVVQTDSYDGDTITMTDTSHAVIAVGGVPTAPDSSRLRGRTTVSFDDQSRPYQTQAFEINQSGTSAGGLTTTNSLSAYTWYDQRGNVMASQQPGGLTTKSVFDGAGRLIKQYTTDGGQTNSGLGTLQSWSDAASVSGDIVLSQVETQYDADGNAILVTSRDRFHNDATNNVTVTGLGDLQNPSTNPKARVSYQSFYYDAASRQTDSAFWGTLGGGATSSISLTSAPARSGTVLVSSISYNDSGWADTITDAKGLVNKSYYDMLGRKTRTVSAFVDPGTNTLQTFSDHNQITDYTYDGLGHVLTQKAWVNNGSGNIFQTTQYVYGVTTSGGSGLNSNDILQKVQYPNTSTGNPGTTSAFIESYTYDAIGEITKKTQRTGSVHQYTYDPLGRMTSDNVITLGTGVNNTIRRLDYAFDTGGRLSTATSYGGTTTATIVNQVSRLYNGLGQITREYQSHSGAVVTSGTATTPSVQYTYNEMSDGGNNSRLTGIIYPTGSRTVTYAYNGNSGLDNVISRLSALSQTLGSGTSAVTTTLENYDYLGTSTVVRVGHPQTGVDLTYEQQTGDSNAVSDGGDIYTGLDRFGRVSDQNYLQTNSGTSLTSTDRFQYGYDANSNAMFRKNLVSSINSELYHSNGTNGYDSLNRLTNFQRGTLASGNTSISSPYATRNWTLDAQGNWSADGTGNALTANRENQYSTVTCVGCCGCGSTTLSFVYDNDGNLTSRPTFSFNVPSHADTFQYDAWDRKATFTHTENTSVQTLSEQTFNLDALGRRMQVVVTDTGSGAGTVPTDDLYYSTAGQVLEDDNVHTAGGGYNQMQFVWSPTYINDLVLRDRSTAGDGNFNERLYVQHDANHNVTAITNTSGAVQERFVYDPYGAVTVLSSTWVAATDTYNWQYMFQGGRYDSTSGLYSFQAREYDPALGRWIQQEPFGTAYIDGSNLNQFVNGNPLLSTDPSGMQGGTPTASDKANARRRAQAQAHFQPYVDVSGGDKDVTFTVGLKHHWTKYAAAGHNSSRIVGQGWIKDSAYNLSISSCKLTPAKIAQTKSQMLSAAQAQADQANAALAKAQAADLAHGDVIGGLFAGGVVTAGFAAEAFGFWRALANIFGAGAVTVETKPEIASEIDNVIAGAAENAGSFFDGTRYTDKVLIQMQGGPGEFHSFPDLVQNFENSGTVRDIVGGDGVTRQILEIPGGYDGIAGTFEFIKGVEGFINHRYFNPD